MRNQSLRFIIGLFLCLGIGAEATTRLNWQSLPALPESSEGIGQPGVAGPFVGVLSGGDIPLVVVGGGANFPEGLPWETREDGTAPPKIYHDTIFVMERADGEWRWLDGRWKLPHSMGYGAAVSVDGEVICIGGESKNRPVDGKQTRELFDSVFSISWVGGGIEIDTEFPSLPEALTSPSAAVVGEKIYVAGGDAGQGATTTFLCLDLAKRMDTDWQWEKLPNWAGSPRVMALSVGQSDKFWLMSGRHVHDGSVDLLKDVWSFDPSSEQWNRHLDLPRCVMAGTVVASGNAHVLVIGGAEGELFRKLDFGFSEAIARAMADGDQAEASELERQKLELLNNHPGFSKDVLSYHTVTDTWVSLGEIDGLSPVTTTAVDVGDEIIIPSGEISPGIRTRQVLSLTFSRDRAFGGLNYLVLVLYLGGVLFNGYLFSRRMKSTNDFFKAGGRIPWWAAGLSIFGTQLSAITFIAIPAKVFATDWRLLVGQFGIVIVAPFIILYFLPYYRKLNVTTAYEYLEQRFNLFVRLFGSVMFMLLQFARIGIVLYLPSVALSLVTGMSVDMCILAMGVLCIVYTVMGGVEAVIWTDVTQVVVLAGGALLCLILIPFQIPGGWNGMIEIADQADKFRVLDFRWEIGSTAFFTVLLGSLASNFVSYGTDQAVVQRYMTTADEKSSARSIWTNGILVIPASFLFFGIGSALFAFYHSHPEKLDPTLSNNESLFPLFIVEQLPAGIAGLLIAGVFAASMSSIDSAMNSVSAAFTTDFYRRLKDKVSEGDALSVARKATVSVGVLGTAFAICMAHSDIKSIWDQFAFFLGLFGGGLGGVFMLGIFFKRCNGFGASVGLIGSGVLQFLLITLADLNPWFMAFTGMFGCVLLGLVASMFGGKPAREEMV